MLIDVHLQTTFEGACEECVASSASCATSRTVANASLLLCDSLEHTRTFCELAISDCIYFKKYGEHITKKYDGACCELKLGVDCDDQRMVSAFADCSVELGRALSALLASAEHY